MPNLDELRAAIDAAAAQAEVPDFTMLRARARTRRRVRRGAVATGVMVVVALTVGGGLSLRTPQAGPAPAPATHPHQHHHQGAVKAKPKTRQQLVALSAQQLIATGRLYSYGSGGSGELVTVWQVCVHDSLYCRYAWRLADQHGQRAIGTAWTGDGSDGPAVTAAGGAYLLTGWDRRGFILSPTGVVTALHPGAREPLLGLEGFVAVFQSGKAGIQAVDTRTGATWRLPLPRGADAIEAATVGADGTVWALPAFAGPGKVGVDWLVGGRWHAHQIPDTANSRLAVPGLLVQWGMRTSPSRVAALSTYDGATSLPVGVLAISTDSGRSWRQLSPNEVPFAAVDSMAADGAGTLYVADPQGRVWRSLNDRWDTFARVAGLRRAYGLQAAGEGVLAEIGGNTQPRLAMITGPGRVQHVAAR